ncbi:MAG: hypothetical protein PHW74_10785 [Desulfobacca sp.]|nr:hypothetical protein [Desulfobacca sp.]
MNIYNYSGALNITIQAQSEYYLLESNCNLIFSDLLFFLKQSEITQVDKYRSRRYARVAIAYMAFYIESLANLVFALVRKMGNYFVSLEYISCFRSLEYIFKNKTKNHLSEPIKKLQAVYYFFSSDQNFPLDTAGIQDIFLIRNQVICHPRPSAISKGTGVNRGKGLTENGKALSYNKFNQFPNIYSEFTNSTAQQLYNEIKFFLKEYYNLVAQYIPNRMSGLFIK